MLRNVPFLEEAKPDVMEGLAKVAVERSFQRKCSAPGYASPTCR